MTLDLDVDSPSKVAEVLRAAANAYYDSAIELQLAWQDANAGWQWPKLAAILERAADQCDKVIGV